MSMSVVRVGIAGCGLAARIHLDRLLALENVAIAGCSDPDLQAARALADRASLHSGSPGSSNSVPAYSDHRELLRQQTPQALAIFTPHLSHYRVTMDALQAGCHVFIEKPLTTNSQEAADIVSLARGRSLKVGVGHQFRLCPSLIEARRRVSAGKIGAVRMVTATLARPWLSTLAREESTWRFDPQVADSGILADAGGHLVDALLWTTGQKASEVGALQSRRDPLIDLVTAAAIRLMDGTPVALGVSGIASHACFALTYYGEEAELHATDQQLFEEKTDRPRHEVPLPAPDQTIDGNWIGALLTDAPMCCPAHEALESVRLLEAIARSAATGQFVRLI
jgi:predicted dehydrogenase